MAVKADNRVPRRVVAAGEASCKSGRALGENRFHSAFSCEGRLRVYSAYFASTASFVGVGFVERFK